MGVGPGFLLTIGRRLQVSCRMAVGRAHRWPLTASQALPVPRRRGLGGEEPRRQEIGTLRGHEEVPWKPLRERGWWHSPEPTG